MAAELNSSVSIPSITLSNASGVSMPVMAYGTGTAWFERTGKGNSDDHPLNQQLIKSIKQAIQLGFFHIDCAEVYGTEREVGVAIAESGVHRSKLFITTKVNTRAPSSMSNLKLALENSLRRLNLSYVDLYLIHSPFFDNVSLKDSWAAMEELVPLGLTRAIGVSNYRISDLEIILASAKIKPAVNQIEYHPYIHKAQIPLINYCKSNNIVITSYGPLIPVTRSTYDKEPLKDSLERLAESKKASSSQLLLKWNLSKNVSSLVTTSSKPDRLISYLASLSLSLTNEEYSLIEEASAKLHVRKFWADQNFGDEAVLAAAKS